MTRHIFLLILLIALFMGSLMMALGDVTCVKVTYNNWKDAYQLSNGAVELVYVPQIGRVMRYAFIGGTNVLWNNPALFGQTTDLAKPGTDWINYGGDKLWPAPQSNWSWPPDPILESSEQLVTVTRDNHLLVEGHTSGKYGIRFLREISLDETGTGVTFKNTMLNARKRAQSPATPQAEKTSLPTADRVTWGLWQITQVDSPSEARLLINTKGHFPTGYYTFKDSAPVAGAITVTPTNVKLRRDPVKSAKIGGDSPQGYLEADVHNITFRVSARVETGKTYPDDGCAQEIWSNTDPLPYMELELLGPIHTLEPGKSAVFTTRWSLTRK
jgi:hypothetical protein